MKTGIYYRIVRDGKYKSVALDDMSAMELEELLKTKSPEEISLLVFHLVKSINFFTCGDVCRKDRYIANHKGESDV